MKKLININKIIWLLALTPFFFGCEDDDTNVVVADVVASFVHDINEETGMVSFINLSENADSFSWDLGDGSTSDLINPTNTYPTGTYTIVLTATNASGSATFSDQIVIDIPLPINFPINFDDPNVNYDISTFNGASFEIVENPDASGSNPNVTNVGALTNVGAAFEGFTFPLGVPLDFTDQQSVKVNFWSNTPTTVLLKLEEGSEGDIETTASHGGTGWEQIYFTFNSMANYSRITFFVDGPGTTAGTFYFDDIEQISNDEVPCPETELELPIDFDCNSIDYATKIVGDVSFTVLENPELSGINSEPSMVGRITNSGAEWENAFFNLDVPIDFTTDKGVKMKFFSNQALPILLKFEDGTEPFTENAVNHGGTGWEELTFVLNSSATFNDMVIFVDGPGTAAGTFYVDDIEQVAVDAPPPFDDGLLTNGDFEDGPTAWSGNALNVLTEGGNSFNFANVMAAGNPFDVNLSQVVPMTQGETYELSFKASSDGNRTMVVGIGLSVNPFTADTQEINLTTDQQEYTLTFSSAAFGGPDSRVIFDMGADTGVVVIDDVALFLEGDGGGGGGTGDNIAVNGDFETGDDTGWMIFPNGGTAQLDNTISNGGSWSGLISVGDSGGNPGFKQERIGTGEVAAGDVIQVSFDVIGSISQPGAVVNVLLFGEGSTEVSFTHVLNPGPELSDTWQTFTGSYTIPPGTDVADGISVLIEGVCGAVAGCGVNMNIDNLEVIINPE